MIYRLCERDEWLQTAFHNEYCNAGTKVKYFNVPCCFDIETTSFYDAEGRKSAIMWIWVLNCNGYKIIGRTWDEFTSLIAFIQRELSLDKSRRLMIFIHNESFEMGFFKKWFQWDKLFALDVNKPVYAITGGIEFRCSYILSGYGLAKLGEQCLKYKCKKLVGDLDYSKLRHTKSKFTYTELGYVCADTDVVVNYIREKIENEGGIDKLLITNTSYVREYVRNKCFFEADYTTKRQARLSTKYQAFQKYIHSMNLTPSEYELLLRAFAGGFVHSNPTTTGEILHNVQSWDFTSSYPTVMLAEQFPCSTGELYVPKDLKDFIFQCNAYCCVMDVEFEYLESREHYDYYISKSKCWEQEKIVESNGRVVSAKRICISITNVDFDIIKKMYKWGGFKLLQMYRYKKGYLHRDFCDAILELYEKKTKLKGVESSDGSAERAYMMSKGHINSCYGMICTKINTDTVYFDENNDMKSQAGDLYKAIEKYNRNINRFLFFPVALFVTAYARRNIISGLIEFKSDYHYSDTDSLKVTNPEAHMPYINAYNELITRKLEAMCEYYGFDKSRLAPVDIKGKPHPLGVYDDDGRYTRFKTLGAKRYLTETADGELHLTVAGLGKKAGLDYLKETYKTNSAIFEAFEDGLKVPASKTGKNTHTYIDTERRGYMTDYNGDTAPYYEKSCIHLEATSFEMGLAPEFAMYIEMLKSADYVNEISDD